MAHTFRLRWKYEWWILNGLAWTSRKASPGWVSWALALSRHSTFGFCPTEPKRFDFYSPWHTTVATKNLDTVHGSSGLVWRPDAVGGLLWLRPFGTSTFHIFPQDSLFTISTPAQITFLFWQSQGIVIPWSKGTRMGQSFRDCKHSIQPI